jgi:hypothetical protein
MMHKCTAWCFSRDHNCGGDPEKCRAQACPCKKDFPKPLCDATHVAPATGYMIPRRRAEEDQFTVEFNEELLLLWDGHCNVKVASTATIIAYLFSYTFKGNDKTAYLLEMEKTSSPVLAYRKARYLSSMEACWRMFSFQNAWIEPKITVLQVAIPYEIGGNTKAWKKPYAHFKSVAKSEERGKLDDLPTYFYRRARKGVVEIWVLVSITIGVGRKNILMPRLISGVRGPQHAGVFRELHRAAACGDA